MGARVIGHRYPANGHYRVVRRLPLLNSQGAGAVLVAFRNITSGATSQRAQLEHLRLRLLQTTAPTAAIEVGISGKIARGYSASDSTNGTALTLTGNNAKKATKNQTSVMEIREATVAAGATGGTKTLDADAFFKMALWELLVVPTAGPVPEVTYEWEADLLDADRVYTFDPNEGFVILNDNVLGAAAAGILFYDIAWAETDRA